MKKMRFGILLAALLTVCMSVTAFADDYTGKEGMEVAFNGTDLVANFDGADLGTAGELQPGDTVTCTITVKNTSGKSADFWMKNEIIKSFEESVSASGGAYTYQLAYNGTDIYNSQAVGGVDTSNGEGLHEATNAMEDYIFLETLANGGSGVLTLKVGVDGITQGNAYQNAIADLMIKLAAEETPVAEDKIVHEKKIVDQTERVIRAVKTGDNSPIMALSIAAAVSGAALLLIAILMLRRRAAEKGGRA